jgi:hypothetical protein
VRWARARWGAALAVSILLGVGPTWSAGPRVSCHIHPPAEQVERGEAAATIGPYPSTETCEEARAERFGTGGRCHCTATFAGSRLPRAPSPITGMPGEPTRTEAPLP